MRLILSFALAAFILGCGSRPTNEGAGYVYTKLSDEDAKKLITPTVYHIPQIDQRALNCSVDSQKKIITKSGDVLATVCSKAYQACLLQGTCRVQLQDKSLLLNVSEKIDGQYRFKDLSKSICRYGHGPTKDRSQSFKSMCLDPYYSIAADLSIYKLGDVVFIPAFVGLKMLNGQTHDGYFIVRDSGSNIKGYGRFDFFMGDALQNQDRQNFLKLGLADKNTHYPYYLIEGDDADRVLKERNFPYLPRP